MGNCMTIRNETPYPFSYCYCYQASNHVVQGGGKVGAGGSAEIHHLVLPSFLYLQYGSHHGNDVRYNSDLMREYNPVDNPTFYIRVRGHDQSIFELTCDRGGPISTCPNYGKQEEDRIRMEREREEEKKRAEEKRKREEERKRAEEKQKSEEERRKAEEERKREEEKRRAEEERKREEERRRRAEEKQKSEEERRKAEEERKREEEKRRAEEERKREEERRRAEEERKREEERRRAEEKQKSEEERRKAEEERKREEEKRRAEEERKREEERRRAEEERKREEERRRAEEERKRAEEEMRRQVRLEQERRIQEDIQREKQSLEKKLAETKEKLQSKRCQVAEFQQHSQILNFVVDDDALAIQANEIKYVEEKFHKLLKDYNIQENEIMLSRNIAERIMALQHQAAVEYSRKNNLPMFCLTNMEDVFSFENLSLSENIKLLKAMINVCLTDSAKADFPMSQNISKIDAKTYYLSLMINKLYKKNKTIAKHVMQGIINNFSTFNQEFISQIIFNNIWTPTQALEFYLEAGSKNISQCKVERILHEAQTYMISANKAISALNENDPTMYLKMQIMEGDKDVKSIVEEMRSNGHPENLLRILEVVLQEVVRLLPNFSSIDLDENMKNEGIQEIRNIDIENPNIKSLVKILIGLSVAIEDTTTSKSRKGYFPRATQLASLLTLLLFKTPDTKSCLLEIATGEGKSTIVAMFALIQAIRGKTVDIITSNPVLARRDQEEWKKLYDMFDVTCSVIPPKGIDECSDYRDRNKLLQDAYKCDVVYGTVDAFAADILRQEFEKKTTRGNRKFDIALVDEVDYMTLDNGVQITFLSHDATGMRHLDQLLTAIWARVCFCQRIEEAETGDIFWTSGIQYFHKLITDAVLGQQTSENFTPDEILICAVQEGFLGEEDLEIIKSEKNNSSESATKGVENNPVGKLLKKLGPSQQKALLTIFGKALDDAVQFKFYELKNGKASLTESSCETNDSPTISVLLLEEGKACMLMSEKNVIDATAEEISSKTKYSDSYQPTDIKDSDGKAILLPGFLKEYVKNRLNVFIENALRALVMEKGRQYTIDSREKSDSHESDCIIPIDFKSTGVLEKNKRWGDGLQQFLEIKHQLAITPLSNVTNFMSNVHFFQRYSCNSGVYGVSGTLGDESEFIFLKKHFKTSCYPMPTHRHTKKVEIPTIQVGGGKEAWITEICKCIKKRTSPKEWIKGQAVLVICEDVKTAEELQLKLIELNAVSSPEKITLYTRNDKHDVEKRVFDSGDVILATNLGGRGTDIKVTDNVNCSGGLFVYLTHLPANLRVEKQIFGRTSRKGNPGMVQMILNQQNLSPSYKGQSVEMIRDRRERYEDQRILYMENDELLEVDMRHELFTHFCKFLDEFENNYSLVEKSDIYNIKASHSYMSALSSSNKLDYQPALNALKETWAIWLTLHEEDINNHKDLMPLKDDLSKLLSYRSENLLQGTSNNFYDFIKVAMDRTYLHINDHENDYGALDYWRKVENTDPVYSAISLYNRAFITINLEKENYEQEAIDLLTEAKKTMNVYICEATNVNSFGYITHGTGFPPHHEKNNFTLQIEARMGLLKAWVNSIDKSIEKLQDLKSKKEDAITKEIAIFGLLDNYSNIVAAELSLLYDYGLSFVFEVKKKPKFCIDALICFILGVLQVLAGIAVCVLTLGAATQIGMGFISEGISDMISGAEGMIKGAFDWAEWAISKAISIALSLVTAGFNVAEKVAKAVFKAGKELLNGTRSLASAAKSIASSTKAILTTATKSVKTVASKASVQTVSQSIKTFAKSETTKVVLKETLKSTGKVLVTQAASKALDYAVDAGVEAVFKEIIKNSIKKQVTDFVKGNTELEKALITFIVENGVPDFTLKSENPSHYKIFPTIENQTKEMVSNFTKHTFKKIVNEDQTARKVVSGLQKSSKFVIAILKEMKANGSLIKGIQLSVHIAQTCTKLADTLNSLPTGEVINGKIIPILITKLPGALNFKNDDRRKFPEVSRLNQELQNSVSACISDEFIDLIAAKLTDLVKTEWGNPFIQEATGELKKNANEWLLKTPMKKFFVFSSQTDIKSSEKSDQGDHNKEKISAFIKNIQENNDMAIHLKLKVLTKCELLNNQGIILTIIKDGKKISTEHYSSLQSSEKNIQIQMQESTNGKLKFSYVESDGTVSPATDYGELGLYQAVSKAISKNDMDIKESALALKKGVELKMHGSWNDFLPLVHKEMLRQELAILAINYRILGVASG
ncbi:uncharacterized protein LOC128635611 [Bombina bombina]|uniref:uncharacterized protein LOC128635611 n=1 Tax=Bombina bombina TaxID=8345 RepID=UPI00235B1AB1|nr:uncharacterized protein LOC128635611 [Bombina bombina]XP_053544650.1 uncharacterized protein LOC128635611 [Bombina bombina]